jgi:hypothetical protein
MTTKQPSDPVIDEVREVRRRISEQCGHDPERLVAYYMELQQQFADRLIERVAPPVASDQPAA